MPESPSTAQTTLNPIRQELDSFVAALSFLTRLPMPKTLPQQTTLARSVIYFPLVGLVVACMGGAIFHLCAAVLPNSVAVVAALITMTLCTGGFHEDGLADSADGIGGGWAVEDKLRIMKDSRIGTYGALALILAVALKISTLSAIAADTVFTSLICAHVLARWSTLPLLRYASYVGGGTGNPFLEAVTGIRLCLGSLLTIIIVVAISPQNAAMLIAVAVMLTGLGYRYFKHKLSGITGDCLGATNQLIEVSVYLVICTSYA